MVARPVVIDCDPGQDDAVALLLALASPEEIEVLGVTTVAGNVPVELTQKNARRICELAGRPDTKVFAGCSRPLLRPLKTGEAVHGPTGLEGAELPEPTMPLQAGHAVDFLVDTLLAANESVTLCATAPLTNIALAIVKEPRILEAVGEIVLMGGAIAGGNITPVAETNIHVDPHAAHVVFTAGTPIVMLGLDVTHKAPATPARVAAIRDLGTRPATAVAGMLDYYGERDRRRGSGREGPPLHDPCVIAYLLRPGLFRGREAHVAIETTSEFTLGQTVVDRRNVLGRAPNALVIDDLDADGFYALLVERLARL